MQINPSLGSTSRPTNPANASIFPRGFMLPFLLTTTIFFMWGMSNNLTDILVQQFRKSFELNLIQAQLVQTSIFLAYFVMATPAALLMRKLGYKAGVLTGLLTFGIGNLLFLPAALVGKYPFFLIALFVAGSGQSILETACNPMIAQFGDPLTSERRLNFSQSFNPPGTIAGALIGTWFIFSGVEKTPAQVAAMKAQGTYAAYLHSETLRVVPTYIGLGLVVLLLATAIFFAKFPRSIDSTTGGKIDPVRPGAYSRLFATPSLVMAVIAQFFYVGAQVTTWSNLIPYIRAYTSLGDKASGYFLTATLIALGAGRAISTPLMRFFNPAKMIGVYAIVNCLLLAVGIFHPGMTGAIAILLTSFFMSIMFPTIFALGVKGLGDDTKIGGSLIVMAILGGAIFPPAQGWIGRATSHQSLGYALPALAYILVACYGFIAPRFSTALVSAHSVEIAPQNI